MAHRLLQRVRGIDEETCKRLNAVGIATARDLLTTSPFRIMVLADLGLDQVQNINKMTAEAVVSECKTVLAYLKERTAKRRFLKTGVVQLDKALRGGLLLGTLSDICGQPGAGKTQLCIGCMVQAFIEGGSVVLYDTEHKFDAVRLVQIATETFPQTFSPAYRVDASHKVDELLNAVKIKRPNTVAEFEASMAGLEEEAIEQKVSLIVIDSIAALLKKEGMDEKQREAFVMTQSSNLKRIADACSCAVVATNQVSPMIYTEGGDVFGDIIQSDGLSFLPALGATWHHCITTRITLSANHSNLGGAMRAEGELSITKSPLVANASLPYVIGPAGLLCNISI